MRSLVVAVVLLLSGLAAGVFASPDRPADLERKPATLEGQIVCSNCWFGADRATTPYGDPDDIECAARCANSGVPTALAVREGDGFALYILRHPPPKGGEKGWLPHVGRFVRASGWVGSKDGKKTLQIASFEALPAPAFFPKQDEERKPVEIELSDLAGASQKLSALRGKLVVLNFWATWCVPCRKEMPAFCRIQNRFAAYDVQVIAAAADELRQKDKVNFPIWLGARSADMASLGLGPALPATVIIDRQGTIVERFQGVIDEKDLAGRIERLLESAGRISAVPGPSARVPAVAR